MPKFGLRPVTGYCNSGYITTQFNADRLSRPIGAHTAGKTVAKPIIICADSILTIGSM